MCWRRCSGNDCTQQILIFISMWTLNVSKQSKWGLFWRNCSKAYESLSYVFLAMVILADLRGLIQEPRPRLMFFTCWWIGFLSSWFCRWQPMHWLTTCWSALLMEWTHLSPNLSRLRNWSRFWSSLFLVLTALKAPQCNWLPMDSGQEKLCYCTRNRSRGVCTTVQSEFMECFFVEWSCTGEWLM